MKPVALPLVAAAALAGAATAHAETPVRWLSQSQTTSSQYPIEKAAMDRISEDHSADLDVQRSEFQTLGINMGDGLRLVRAGTFDIASITVGLVARDEPFLEGIDLIGVATSVDELRDTVDAYREVFDERLGERFGVKALAIWPFGAQVFFCNEPIQTLDDLEGMKVRSFTASMSTLLERLGATPVTLSFPEVYPALQRGVASCGITSATSANTGKWPEVTTHLLPISVSGAVQTHIANLDWWNGLPEESRRVMETAFRDLESELWDLASSTNEMAVACSTGQPSCSGDLYGRYDMELVSVSEADLARVREIAEEVVVGEWVERCERTYEGCGQVWSETVGKARGMTAR